MCQPGGEVLDSLGSKTQGGSNGSLAKTAANVPIQLFCSLDSRHVGSSGDALAHRSARLHLVALGRETLEGFLYR